MGNQAGSDHVQLMIADQIGSKIVHMNKVQLEMFIKELQNLHSEMVS